jgi:hypothetical protein
VRDQRRGSDTTVATVQNHRRHVALAALVAVVLTLGAVSCGDDSSSDDSSADTNTLATSDDTGDDTEEADDDTEEATDGDDAELTAEDICSMLTGDARRFRLVAQLAVGFVNVHHRAGARGEAAVRIQRDAFGIQKL